VILCTLDLEARDGGDEPMAAVIAARLVAYARTAPTRAVQPAVLLGDAADGALLDRLGLAWRRADALPVVGTPVVLGRGWAGDEGALRAWLTAGGHAVALPRQGDRGSLGITLIRSTTNGGGEPPAWAEAAGLSPSDLHWRNQSEAWLIGGGCEVAGNGQLGRLALGAGSLTAVQFDPDRFDADKVTYFRFTRWRQTRALTQVLVDAGIAGKGGLEMSNGGISLAAPWRVDYTQLVQPHADGSRNPDPGMSAEAKALLTAPPPVAGRERMPQMLAKLNEADGEFVLRLEVRVPEAWAGKDLRLSLGPIDDFDSTCCNGTEVGHVDIGTPGFWSVSRSYRVPAALVKPGINLIAVRVWDHLGGGGFGGMPDDLHVEPVDAAANGLYYPDFRSDFNLGDNPYRYMRW
jgi:beta-galactosidase